MHFTIKHLNCSIFLHSFCGNRLTGTASLGGLFTVLGPGSNMGIISLGIFALFRQVYRLVALKLKLTLKFLNLVSWQLKYLLMSLTSEKM